LTTPFTEASVSGRFEGSAGIAADGSSVITKHPGQGGTVSLGTVTAQLLYEIAGPYLNPDVTARSDSFTLHQIGPDRVASTVRVGTLLRRRPRLPSTTTAVTAQPSR
jgi:hypothetical protein